MGLTYLAIKTFSKGVLSFFFRKIYVIGSENIPKDGPVIFCGNHSNQFIDPMMIMANCDREISFTMAASSFSKPVVGQIASLLKCIPVHRPEDGKKKGTGKIKIESNTLLKGIGSRFTQDSKNFSNGIASIQISNLTLIVDKIVDDETIIIKDNKEETLPNNKEFDYFFIPKINNSDLFKEAYQILNENGCVCIFPEGTSHDRTDFIKLKAGIALMTLGAMSESKCKNVNIVPVGLNYFKRDQFRSEVIIEFGNAFEVPTEWANEYTVQKRQATEKLLNEIESRMKAVTLTAPSFQELRSLFLVRKLYVPKDITLTPTEYSELCKRFSKGYAKLKDKEETKEMMKKVNKYINELETTGLGDHEVKKIEFTYSWMVRKTFWRFLLFHFYLILCLPAIVILTPFAYIIKRKAEKERIAAKAKNPNKVEAIDVVASVKVQYSILFMPFIFLIWILLFIFYFNRYINYRVFELGWIKTFSLGTVIFPVYLYSSARMLDSIFFYLQIFISRFLYFLYPKNIVKLKTQRECLVKEVLEFVNNYISEADPKYEKERVLFAKEKELGEKNILIRRNSMRKTSKDSAAELKAIFS